MRKREKKSFLFSLIAILNRNQTLQLQSLSQFRTASLRINLAEQSDLFFKNIFLCIDFIPYLSSLKINLSVL